MPDTTGPKPTPFAAQTNALRALLRIAELHPGLPGAYVVSHSTTPDRIDVQLDTPSAWETWRETLSLPTDSVTHGLFSTREILECETTVDGTTVRIYAVFPRVDTIIRTYPHFPRAAADVREQS
ncbi:MULTISPECIES: hypothetical protein [unclassified Streptomyces]|uniref:hypothetical protein n=1 Tax=unclassified Streptomyces TaxID=2593676 RepID=UPI002E29A595|nr:hypothetical protein [Streptomyces sp. NBC_00223]